MSSSQISRNRRLCVVTAACLFLSLNSVAAPKEVSLKVDGVATLSFGQKACNKDNMVEVVLPGDITKDYSDFRAIPQWSPKTDTKNIKKCPPSIHDNMSGVITFTKDSPSFEQKKLLRPSACKEDGKGDQGTGILCIYPEASGASDLVAESPKYTYETKVAKIDDKDITEKSAVNGVIEFLVNPSGTTAIKSVEVCYGKRALGTMPEKGCPKPWGSESFSNGQVMLKDLENNVEYSIKAQITDYNDNTSPWSKVFYLTPKAASMPLDSYDGAGGLGYNCQSAESSWLFIGALFLVLFLLRRRHCFLKHGNMLLLLAFIITMPNEAEAYVGQVSVGILGSMYRPDLDNEKTQDGQDIFPFYRCQFRKKPDAPHGPITPLMGTEIDVNLFDKFGTLQLGLGLGYTFVRGKGLEFDKNGSPDCDKQLDEAPASLHMWQVRPQLTYLFDSFAYAFPLYPYLRGAFITHGYSFRSGKHASATVDNDGVQVKPNGFRFGWQAAAGLMLRLDFLEPGAVRSARGAGFFDHVALKAELSYTKITSFGRRGFNFSPKDVMGSRFPLLWTFGLVFNLP